MKEDNVFVRKSFAFAIKIVKASRLLVEHKKEYVLSKQLLRSGTAVGALIREAQNAESKSDFVHKLSIAQKECDETLYWLDLLKETNYLNNEEYLSLRNEAEELLKMLRSSILTTKKNHLNKQQL
ncbi:MAG TPA: four helix bundle protein [Bacteroidia bacterium]|nr:four helix bundle protein [Bacteroidia bacterium]HRD37747.1 four helix bundle protein [Bacteroidia bacterium]